MNTKKLPIPDFKSIEEEADFWDTHDTEDFQWEPAPELKFSKNLTSVYENVIPITIDKKTQKAIEKVAKIRKVKVPAAAKILIEERLSQLKAI